MGETFIVDWWVTEKMEARIGGTRAAKELLSIDANPHITHDNDPMDQELAEIWDQAYKGQFRTMPEYLNIGD